MRPMISPTTINLKDLPDQGENYTFTRQSGELTGALSDLIQSHDYNIDFHLRPMGNAFEITGEIHAKMDILCSRCGRETEQDIDDNFRELIVVEEERPRAGHTGHTGLGFEDGIYCNYLPSYNLNLAEVAHEHIAAAEPYQALCGRADCEAIFEQYSKNSGVNPKEWEKTNPFAALKNMDIKPQKG